MQQLCSSCVAVIERDCGKLEIQFILSRRSLYAVANNHRVAVTASGRWAWFWQHFESVTFNAACLAKAALTNGNAHAAKFRKAPGDVLPILPKEL